MRRRAATTWATALRTTTPSTPARRSRSSTSRAPTVVSSPRCAAFPRSRPRAPAPWSSPCTTRARRGTRIGSIASRNGARRGEAPSSLWVWAGPRPLRGPSRPLGAPDQVILPDRTWPAARIAPPSGPAEPRQATSEPWPDVPPPAHARSVWPKSGEINDFTQAHSRAQGKSCASVAAGRPWCPLQALTGLRNR